jgi:hypothetical protein
LKKVSEYTSRKSDYFCENILNFTQCSRNVFLTVSHFHALDILRSPVARSGAKFSWGEVVSFKEVPEGGAAFACCF